MNYGVHLMDATPSEASGLSFTPVLCVADIPGAELSKPFDKHTVAALRWWPSNKGSFSWKKSSTNRTVQNKQH